MRMSLTVNGVLRTTASLPGPGFLSAHLNMADRPKDGTLSKRVRLVAQDTSSDTETTSSEWPAVDLEIGDVIELQVLPEGDGDTPSRTFQSSDSPSNLLRNTELAKDVLQMVKEFDARLMDLVSRAEAVEDAGEYKKFTLAVGSVLWETAARLLYPIYRRHKELVPDSLKGERL